LNVFLCCLQTPDQWAIPGYAFWRQNFKPALEELGCRVIEPAGLDLAEPLARWYDPEWLNEGRQRLGEALLDQVKEVHRRDGIQLFLSYFYAVHVEPDVLQAIRDLGIPVVNFFCDNVRQFESVQPLVHSVTLNWVPEADAMPMYRRLGAPAVHLPMAVHPQTYQAGGGDELEQVTFVGHADHLRMHLLDQVLDTQVPLRIYGHGWRRSSADAAAGSARSNGFRHPQPPSRWRRRRLSAMQHLDRLRKYGPAGEWRHFEARRVGARLAPRFKDAAPPLPHDEFVSVTARSAVTLGINRCPHPGYPMAKPLVYSRLRDIEAPSTGACYLTEWCPEIEQLYDIGNEIETYRDSSELVAKSRALLKDISRRRQLRAAGRRAVLARHTCGHRFRALFKELNITMPQPAQSERLSSCESR